LEPYRGKPAVRNLRGDDGNVGIIRSPVRAIVLPDRRRITASGDPVGAATIERWRLPRKSKSSLLRFAAIQGIQGEDNLAHLTPQGREAFISGLPRFTHLLRPARLLGTLHGSDRSPSQRRLLLPGFQRLGRPPRCWI
jgi:hypothetical protein